MLRHVRIIAIGCLVAVTAAAPAAAQITTGSILVKTVDEQGGVIPGVTVAISSPTLVAGRVTGTTDVTGSFRFPSLPPGMYTVRVELQGFQTIVREDIRVLVGDTTIVELGMKVATVSEVVTVRGDSPVVDTTNANVNVHLDQKLLETTPGGRDIWSIVEYKVPGFGLNSVEIDMDAFNVTNEHTVFDVRTGSNLQTVRVGGTGESRVIPQFMSPTGILGPRILRFNVTYKFGGA